MTAQTDNYQVLARTWRPQRFAELVGQEHITRTLQNTIRRNRVGHAYLFVGPRGIGKTTVARIFAKALNCERGPADEPCCECDSCRDIAETRAVDVQEIDGASHNKVDDVRDIRDNVVYAPARGRYKIYIIDEVHMLTPAAWNALLKTLEEPPPHVKFFFATTEPHKVLATILSRCQRFDLRRMTVPVIVRRLAQVAEGEGIAVDPRALDAMARAADGGMRDALSIFDQIIAFHAGAESGEPIRENEVIEVFGLVSSEEMRRLVAAMLEDDLPGAMRTLQGLADQGRDLDRLYADVVRYLRNLMMLAVAHADDLVEAGEAELEDLRALAASPGAALAPRLLEGLMKGEYGLRNALNKRVYLEATTARLMRHAHSMQIEDVIRRLNELRGKEGLQVETPNGPPPQPTGPTTPPTHTTHQAHQTHPPPANPAPERRPETPRPPPRVGGDAEGDGLLRCWDLVLANLARDPDHAALRSVVDDLRPVSLINGILQLAYPEDISPQRLELLQANDTTVALNQAFRTVCTHPNAQAVLKRWIVTVSSDEEETRKKTTAEAMELAARNPAVQRTIAGFDGRLVDAKM